MKKRLEKWKTKKRLTIIVLSAVVLLSGGGFSYYYLTAQENVAAVSYQTSKVKKGDLTVTVDSSGVIEYGNQMDITPTVNGTVTKIYVQEGAKVEAGDPLFAVDDSSLQNQINQAKNELKSAQIKLADLLQTTVSNVNKVTVDRLLTIYAPADGYIHYNVQTGSPVGGSTGASSSIATIQNKSIMRFIANVPVERITDVKVGQVAEIQSDDGISKVIGKVERIFNTEVWVTVNNPGNLEKGLKGTAVIQTAAEPIEDAKGQYEYVSDEVMVFSKVSGNVEKLYVNNDTYVKKGTPIIKISNPSLINDIESQKLNISNIQLKIDQLEKEKDSLIQKAPIAGIIRDLSIAEGQAIAPSNAGGSSGIAKIESNDLVANIEVDEVDIAKVAVGQEANLTIQALLGETIIGKVSSISTTGIVKDGVTTYKVTIIFPANEKVKAGMTVDASIIVAKAENVLMVPNSSVIEVKDGKSVRVMNGDLIKMKPVEVGISNDTMTEIKSGLLETDVVVTAVVTPTTSSSSGTTSSNSSLVPSNVTVPGINGGGGRK
ncbi:efflux RND transporter periplasmic adaptor subunit [Tepidibacillus fermentans]|uniref:HlyD family secretion protein n=1 Tax=Tepidibacillus fermentans TaxID=1281767 RepID=A0A4V2UT76_9BACI|nr:efflux RND transporter periplasmic adaptor subunit [Tepidibacillus fermentans]TCS84589.1 HlyD family secretion protein [Tepidibacillus fermentans]